MLTYPIAAAAEELVVVTIARTGEMTWARRRRDSNGEFRSDPEQRRNAGADGEKTALDFLVRVGPGHSGVVEISSSGGQRALIPLGADRPFLESELPMRAGANGAYAQSEAVRFSFAVGVLRWATENLCGQLELDAATPAISVALRLPAGNDGEVVFGKVMQHPFLSRRT